MQTLQGQNINLRAVEPEDLNFLYQIENNVDFWEASHTQTPFSKFLLKKYIENCHLDIYEAKQLRLVIEERRNNNAIGLIDLFEFDPQHKRAGIGIVILKNYQNNGFASDALTVLINYCFNRLNLHQLFANIACDNQTSISLFKKHLFKQVGIKKDWIFSKGSFKDEILFQFINEK